MVSRAYHTVSPVLSRGLGSVDFRFLCTAPVGSPCRLHCPEGCECNCTHDKVDQGECDWLLWMDTAPAEELYGGEGEVVIHPGPVKFIWDGDMITWEYDEEGTPSVDIKAARKQAMRDYLDGVTDDNLERVALIFGFLRFTGEPLWRLRERMIQGHFGLTP